MCAPTCLNEQAGHLVVRQFVNELVQLDAINGHATSVRRGADAQTITHRSNSPGRWSDPAGGGAGSCCRNRPHAQLREVLSRGGRPSGSLVALRRNAIRCDRLARRGINTELDRAVVTRGHHLEQAGLLPAGVLDPVVVTVQAAEVPTASGPARSAARRSRSRPGRRSRLDGRPHGSGPLGPDSFRLLRRALLRSGAPRRATPDPTQCRSSPGQRGRFSRRPEQRAPGPARRAPAMPPAMGHLATAATRRQRIERRLREGPMRFRRRWRCRRADSHRSTSQQSQHQSSATPRSNASGGYLVGPTRRKAEPDGRGDRTRTGGIGAHNWLLTRCDR